MKTYSKTKEKEAEPKRRLTKSLTSDLAKDIKITALDNLANGGGMPVTQKIEMEEEELIQGKFTAEVLQKDEASAPKQNDTGLPNNLKAGVENLSGHSLDDVKVHYNSSTPNKLQAHAYAQGKNIFVASGQERHLPHEAWHVVQQKQGRVQPTIQTKGGININDDDKLEKEADEMGAKALQMKSVESHAVGCGCPACSSTQLKAKEVVQLKCRICGANSHTTKKCPNAEKETSDEESGESAGRGLSKGGKNERYKLDTLLEKLDPHSMYGTGAKSLVGGFKGKPSGLKDTSARIDRQGEGNVQFQVGGSSFAGVTFSQETDPEDIIAALISSFESGEMERL